MISDGIRKWCDDLRVLADRIDREMMELPKDADGEPIRVGDVLYSSGNECRVVSITVKSNEACVGVHTDEGAFLPSVNPKYLSRKKPEVLDADGAPIKVGDTVYCNGEDKPLMVSHIVDSTKVALIADRVSYFMANPSRLSHECPDSWERLEEDANLGCRDYCEKHRLEECDYNMRVHILARAKKLAGIEEEAQR